MADVRVTHEIVKCPGKLKHIMSAVVHKRVALLEAIGLFVCVQGLTIVQQFVFGCNGMPNPAHKHIENSFEI